MALVINCECGYMVRGQDRDKLLAGARKHVDQAHPDMAGQMSDKQLLSMAKEE